MGVSMQVRLKRMTANPKDGMVESAGFENNGGLPAFIFGFISSIVHLHT
jgi:hypothetical protein